MDTWNSGDVPAIPVDKVIKAVEEISSQGFDGVTISGGEPFEQLEALAELLFGIRGLLTRSQDLLCYSGLPMKKLRSQHSEILALLDAVIPEPFQRNAAPGKRWRGSANQQLHALTDLGRVRYADLVDAEPIKRMQVSVTEGQAWFIGIPQPGDLLKLESMLPGKGIRLGAASWRA